MLYVRLLKRDVVQLCATEARNSADVALLVAVSFTCNPQTECRRCVCQYFAQFNTAVPLLRLLAAAILSRRPEVASDAFCVRQSSTGAGLSSSYSVFPCQNHFIATPFPYIVWRMDIGPLQAQLHEVSPRGSTSSVRSDVL